MGALVSSSVDGQTAFTDVSGHFYLQTRKPGQSIGFYTVSAARSLLLRTLQKAAKS